MKKIILILLSIYTIQASAQWVQQSSGSINDLSYIFFPTVNVGYVIDYGNILKTTNGGNTWNLIPATLDSGAPLYFSSIDTGYSGGTNGILKTEDGGLSWIDNFHHNNIFVSAMSFLSSNIGYAACANFGQDTIFTFKTTNAGGTWSLINSINIIGFPSSVFFTNSSTGCMIINGIGIYKTINGGVTWIPKLTTLDAGTLNKLYFPSTNIGYSIGGDSIFKSIDGGDTWLNLNYSNTTMLNALYFSDDNNGYAVGGDGFSQGEIIKTTDGGLNWTIDASPVQTFYSMSFPNANTGYVCGTNGAIYKTTTSNGMDEITQENEMSIYPNPFNEQTTITLGSAGSAGSLTASSPTGADHRIIKITDLLGKEIKTATFTGNEYTLEKGEMEAGVYIVEVRFDTSAGSVTSSATPMYKKIIIQ